MFLGTLQSTPSIMYGLFQIIEGQDVFEFQFKSTGHDGGKAPTRKNVKKERFRTCHRSPIPRQFSQEFLRTGKR